MRVLSRLMIMSGLLAFLAFDGSAAWSANRKDAQSLPRDEHGDVDHEAELAKQPSEAALFRQDGPVLTLLSGGKPVATFTDSHNGSSCWYYAGHIDLVDAGGVKHTAWIVTQRDAEWGEDIVVAPDGAILPTGGAIFVSSSGHLVAGGFAADEMDRQPFRIVDWQAHRAFELQAGELNPPHLSDVISMCQALSALPGDRFSVVCASEDRSRGIFGRAERRADGRWQIVPVKGFEGEADDTYLEVDKLRPTPVAPEFAAPIVLQSTSLKGTTASYVKLGYRWLGKRSPGG